MPSCTHQVCLCISYINNRIESQQCLQTIWSISYKSMNQFWLNLPYINGKTFSTSNVKKNPHFQIDIFVIGCEKHSRRNAFSQFEISHVINETTPGNSKRIMRTTVILYSPTLMSLSIRFNGKNYSVLSCSTITIAMCLQWVQKLFFLL